jgi:hypothetical protein
MIISRSAILIYLVTAMCLWAGWEYKISFKTAKPMAGPDVIVGTLSGVSRYPSTGNVSNEVGFAIGTTSCNIGTQRLDWIQNSAVHPVISQNLYRVKNGRFEQISWVSWLKHGFSVAAGSACNTCTDPATNYLGVGCSDPYGSSLNGSFSYMGARSEVNALTGVFLWPKVKIISQSDALQGRMRVHYNDLNTSLNAGARYFSESMYVHPQDAQNGNGLNNSSYREMFVSSQSGGNWTIAFGTPTTVRMEPAINAWKAVHPDVKLFPVDVPGDGRIIVGMRTTAIAGGYHTEFAVENTNSHQCARSLKVNFGSNANTNIGFKDCSYCQESYSGTDWTPTVSNNNVEWATETYATNQNANALRWSTTYSFWCDSQTPPRSFTLGMFRPGTVSEMTVDVISKVTATGVKVIQGSVDGGQPSSAHSSDNQYYVMGPSPKSEKQSIEYYLETTSPTSNPTDFAIRLESACLNAEAGSVVQSVSLFNYDKNQFEEVDSRAASTSDQTVVINPTGDWRRFIKSGTRQMQARVEWKNIDEFNEDPFAWSVNIDESVWLVGQ